MHSGIDEAKTYVTLIYKLLISVIASAASFLELHHLIFLIQLFCPFTWLVSLGMTLGWTPVSSIPIKALHWPQTTLSITMQIVLGDLCHETVAHLSLRVKNLSSMLNCYNSSWLWRDCGTLFFHNDHGFKIKVRVNWGNLLWCFYQFGYLVGELDHPVTCNDNWNISNHSAQLLLFLAIKKKKYLKYSLF